MRGEYTKYPGDLTENIQMNAGVIADDFTPSTGVIGNILGATNSGISFDPKPTFEDFGADIDNMPENTWQMKRVKSYDPTLSGSFRTVTAALVKMLNGAAGFAVGDNTHIVPSHELRAAHFKDVWVIGDYSDRNSGTGSSGPYAGFIAIHVKHALNVTGFKWKTNKDGKGEFDFEYHGHYDLNSPDDPPYEVYIRHGVGGTLTSLTVTSEAGTASGKSKITVSGYSLGTGESFVYRTAGTTAPSVNYGDDVSDWPVIVSPSEITPEAGHDKITVAVADINGLAKAAGSATLVIES